MARWLLSQHATRPASDDGEDTDTPEREEVGPEFFKAHGIEPPLALKPNNATNNEDEEPCTAPEIWPDNLPTVQVFAAMQTQWRMGFAGPTGLDYAALPVVLRMVRVPVAQRHDVLTGVRVMEQVALGVWASQRREEDARKRDAGIRG